MPLLNNYLIDLERERRANILKRKKDKETDDIERGLVSEELAKRQTKKIESDTQDYISQKADEVIDRAVKENNPNELVHFASEVLPMLTLMGAEKKPKIMDKADTDERFAGEELTKPKKIGNIFAEDLKRTPKEFAKNLLMGIQGIAQGTGQAIKAFGETSKAISEKGISPVTATDTGKKIMSGVADLITEFGDTASSYWKEKMAAVGTKQHQGTFVENPSISRAMGTVAQAIPSLGAAVITKDPTRAVAFLGMLEGASTYEQARDAGEIPEKAFALGTMTGVGTAVLENIPMRIIFKNAGSGRVLKSAIQAGVSEGLIEEPLQQVWTNVVEKVGFDEGRNIFNGIVESMIGGFGGGMLIGGVTANMQGVIDEAKQAGLDETTIDKAVESVAEHIGNFANQSAEIIKGEEGFARIGKEGQDSPDQSLIEEAKKYDNPEEFVDSKTTGYHGTTAGETVQELRPSPTGELGEGVYFSRDYEVAKKYGTPDTREVPKEKFATIPLDISNLRFKRMKMKEFQKLRNSYFDEQQMILEGQGKDPQMDWTGENYSKAVEQFENDIKAQGFDGIYVTEAIGGEQGVVFSSSANKIKTKSQLTDIWNKAQGEKATEPSRRSQELEVASQDQEIGGTSGEESRTVGQEDTGLPSDESVSEQTSQSEQSQENIEPLASSKKEPYKDTYHRNLEKATNLVSREITPEKRSDLREAYDSVIVGFKERVVSQFQRVKEMEKRAKEGGIDRTQDLLPSERRTLLSGRVNAKIEETEQIFSDLDKDILQASKEIGVPEQDLRQSINEFLQARHAPERNEVLGDKAAGMSNEEAKNIVDKIYESDLGAKIREIADKYQSLHNQTLDILYSDGKKYGVIDKKLYETLKKKYKNHVPLNRVIDEDNIIDILSGSGFDVRGSGIKRAKGSQREVRDIAENIFAARSQAIHRVEKNILDNEMYDFVEDYNKSFPTSDLFKIGKPKAVGKTFDGKIMKEQISDPRYLIMQRHGKPVYIKIKDIRLATAMRGTNRQQMPEMLRWISSLTRIMASLATRYNPEFAFSNKVRDMQETLVYLASQKDIGGKGVIGAIKKDPASIKAIVDSIRGVDSEGAKLYEQMRKDGGTTGGLGLSTRDQVEHTLKQLRSLNRSGTRRGLKKISRIVDDWNTVFEDSTRLSVYKQALDSGLSRERAAVLAKRASIDFNEFGTWGPIVNGLYMFSNASIQGSAKMLRSMKNPKVLAGVVAAVTSAVFAADKWNDEVDEEWRNKVSQWDRINGLNIVLPTEEFNYISVPVSWGLKPIKAATEYAYDVMTDADADLEKASEAILSSFIDGYNPVGGTDLISAATPSILDVAVDVSRNKTWYGGSIRPDWSKYQPNHIRYFKSMKDSATGRIFINATRKISEATGGRVEISPSDVNYVLRQVLSGTGKFASRMTDTIASIGKGESPEMSTVPMISRFLRNTPEDRFRQQGSALDVTDFLEKQELDRFYKKERAEAIFEELKKMPKEQRIETYKEMYRNDKSLMEKVDDIAEDEALGLTYTDRQIKNLGVSNGMRAKYIFSLIESAETKEDKIKIYKDLTRKKIISKDVAEQLEYMAKKKK